MNRTWIRWLAGALMLGAGVLGASASSAQTREVTFAYQDMLVPLRTLIESGEASTKRPRCC
jgi:taurine transport system substrate-binding protein